MKSLQNGLKRIKLLFQKEPERKVKETRKALQTAQRKRHYPKTTAFENYNWTSDLGRNLQHYARIHTFLLNRFKKRGLSGLAITHFGAGNGKYMDFLRRYYRMQTLAVEIKKEHILEGQRIGMRPRYRMQNAAKTNITPNSQDIIISDHFLFSNYGYINHVEVLKEANRILKPGGLIVIGRCFRSHVKYDKLKFKLVTEEGEIKEIPEEMPFDFIVLMKRN